MGVKLTNNARTFLTTGLSNSATAIVVDSTVAFPNVNAADDYFYATLYNSNGDVEIVKVNSTDANSMTVERAQQDTVADSWDVNDTIDPNTCLLYTSPSPRDRQKSRMPSSA